MTWSPWSTRSPSTRRWSGWMSRPRHGQHLRVLGWTANLPPASALHVINSQIAGFHGRGGRDAIVNHHDQSLGHRSRIGVCKHLAAHANAACASVECRFHHGQYASCVIVGWATGHEERYWGTLATSVNEASSPVHTHFAASRPVQRPTEPHAPEILSHLLGD